MNHGAFLSSAVLIPSLLLPGLSGCQPGGPKYLPVRVTEPAVAAARPGASGHTPWPARDLETEPGESDAADGVVEAAASSSPDEPLPELSDIQWRAEAERVLDDWHLSAARGDRKRYLGHMAPDAVFMGTDASERWDVAKVTSYVDEHFTPGEGWTYYPFERYVNLSSSKGMAWFDEKLNSPGYGALRGTGVLRREGTTWKIVHYSMTFLVPNDIGGEVADMIRAWKAEPVR